MALKEEPLII